MGLLLIEWDCRGSWFEAEEVWVLVFDVLWLRFLLSVFREMLVRLLDVGV